jgi:hypothetical protein
MPYIIEDTATRLRDRITQGATLSGRYWSDEDAPHKYSFYTATAVKRHADGWVTVSYLAPSEERKKPETQELYFAPDDMIALVESHEGDSRLILPGGYMVALPGSNWRLWDAYRADGTPVAQKVSTTEGRALLEEYAPEMIWVHHGDGQWTARGHGHRWKVQRGGHNNDYDVRRDPIWQWWLYDLLACPMGREEWQAIKTGCATPQDAKAAA